MSSAETEQLLWMSWNSISGIEIPNDSNASSAKVRLPRSAEPRGKLRYETNGQFVIRSEQGGWFIELTAKRDVVAV